jgi:hypothetical protein
MATEKTENEELAIAVTKLAPRRACVARTTTAFPHRADGYNLLVLSEWLEPNQDDRCIAWARDTYNAMTPYMGSGRYSNYGTDDDDGDPTNFFRMNQNIKPL